MLSMYLGLQVCLLFQFLKNTQVTSTKEMKPTEMRTRFIEMNCCNKYAYSICTYVFVVFAVKGGRSLL